MKTLFNDVKSLINVKIYVCSYIATIGVGSGGQGG